MWCNERINIIQQHQNKIKNNASKKQRELQLNKREPGWDERAIILRQNKIQFFKYFSIGCVWWNVRLDYLLPLANAVNADINDDHTLTKLLTRSATFFIHTYPRSVYVQDQQITLPFGLLYFPKYPGIFLINLYVSGNLCCQRYCH